MTAINSAKSGLVLALLLGGMHAMWSAIVAIGFAQPLIDFIFWMHFIKPPFVVEPFEALRALMLVGMTAAMGYVLGSVFALLWNAFHK